MKNAHKSRQSLSNAWVIHLLICAAGISKRLATPLHDGMLLSKMITCAEVFPSLMVPVNSSAPELISDFEHILCRTTTEPKLHLRLFGHFRGT